MPPDGAIVVTFPPHVALAIALIALALVVMGGLVLFELAPKQRK